MTETTPVFTGRGVARAAVTLVSLPLAYLFAVTIADYYEACDSGINAAANSLFLTFFVLPAALVVFAVVGFAAFSGVAGPLGRPWPVALIVALLMLALVFVGGHMAVRASTADYPGPCNTLGLWRESVR